MRWIRATDRDDTNDPDDQLLSGTTITDTDEIRGEFNLRSWDNLLGMYQPDTITAFESGGMTYLVTANEGDARGFEEERVDDLTLDPTAFPDSLVQDDVPYSAVTSFVETAAGVYTMTVSVANSGTPAIVQSFDLVEGDIITLYVVGNGSNQALDIIGASDSAGSSLYLPLIIKED